MTTHKIQAFLKQMLKASVTTRYDPYALLPYVKHFVYGLPSTTAIVVQPRVYVLAAIYRFGRCDELRGDHDAARNMFTIMEEGLEDKPMRAEWPPSPPSPPPHPRPDGLHVPSGLEGNDIINFNIGRFLFTSTYSSLRAGTSPASSLSSRPEDRYFGADLEESENHFRVYSLWPDSYSIQSETCIEGLPCVEIDGMNYPTNHSWPNTATPTTRRYNPNNRYLIFGGKCDAYTPLQHAQYKMRQMRMMGADVSMMIDPTGGHSSPLKTSPCAADATAALLYDKPLPKSYAACGGLPAYRWQGNDRVIPGMNVTVDEYYMGTRDVWGTGNVRAR